jgi:hypothetical protein
LARNEKDSVYVKNVRENGDAGSFIMKTKGSFSLSLSLYIYIYIERERERDRERILVRKLKKRDL